MGWRPSCTSSALIRDVPSPQPSTRGWHTSTPQAVLYRDKGFHLAGKPVWYMEFELDPSMRVYQHLNNTKLRILRARVAPSPRTNLSGPGVLPRSRRISPVADAHGREVWFVLQDFPRKFSSCDCAQINSARHDHHLRNKRQRILPPMLLVATS